MAYVSIAQAASQHHASTATRRWQFKIVQTITSACFINFTLRPLLNYNSIINYAQTGFLPLNNNIMNYAQKLQYVLVI